MGVTLYEYKEVYWQYLKQGYGHWAIPFCPVHRMELSRRSVDSLYGICEECKKSYYYNIYPKKVADYLGRKLSSKSYQDAEIISIDGIQTPQLKTRLRIPEENEEYWIEARLNKSDKGRQLVVYVGEKGSIGKVQLFANIDQEKLSFDHKDRKPEEVFAMLTASFPTGKKITIKAPDKNT